MKQRALLTEREREVLQGIDTGTLENPTAYRENIRSRLRKRITNLEQDLEILNEHQPDMATDARRAVCGPEPAINRLRNEIQNLREELELSNK